MSELSGDVRSGGPTDGMEIEPPSMSPASRLINVFFSPGKVFDDIRKSPGGWWLPIVVGGLLFAVFAGIHVAKYDQVQIVREQTKDNAFIKLAPADQQEKIIAEAEKTVRATPKWQSQLAFLGWGVLGIAMTVWFFTFLYGLMALMMGWMANYKASKLFINLGIFVAILLVVIVGTSILTVVGSKALKAGTADSPAAWASISGFLLIVGASCALFYLISRFARDTTYGRVVTAVAFGTAPGIIATLVGILVLVIRTPDATPLGEVIPSNLGAFMDAKTGAKWLVSLASSLDLFSLWAIALTSIGLARALGRKVSEAAVIVLIPWGAWVLLKVAFAAFTG